MKKQNRIKKCIFLFILCFTICMPVLAYPVYGNEKWFETALPYGSGNVYFQARDKQSNVAYGYVKISDLSINCNGINAWFCNSSKSRCSNIRYCSSAGSTQYDITYTSNYNSGAKVLMGIEDYDEATIGSHSVEGYVNYN
ncbi:MAG: hypothetical protein J6A25_06910 [Lachnospiraceae bacterium]|nr:hypothetical protein [Lachnospiraceae bacterium]